ncbi:hypothetical protein ACOSQ2_021557 [Xanthoceras sorbifolium]|uniref:B box-type domain-containing protein n=1 Tax=Xanthoceras sorbifolium TaxID=99658 RepID=A0ABQ8HKJ0_9ROSI|nr:hypothetical protein JRO89_XS09G0053600 [Xanthoceras sorbifolium]
MVEARGDGARACELCGREASLYCDSDSAFLCRSCDAAVHQANFIVARHLRQPLCSKCKSLTGSFVSGATAAGSDSTRRFLCKSCAEETPATSTSMTSEEEDCVSSTESSAVIGFVNKIRTTGSKRKREDRKPIASLSSSVSGVSGENLNIPAGFSCKKHKKASDSRAEGIFVIWCKRLGLDGNLVVSSACQALEFCMERLTTTVLLPFRVCLAASFWLGLRMCDHDTSSFQTCQNLRRLETISGVPAKLIVAIERRLARVIRLRKAKNDLEEGWAECDV